MGLLAIGKVFAYLAAQINASSSGTAMVNFFVILIAYFGPLFLIPKTFSMAGTIFAKTSGSLNNFGRKVSAPAQDFTKKRGTEWAESKYKPGKSNALRNFGTRLATGHIAPTYRSRAELAARATKVESDRIAEDSTLIQRETSGLNYDDKMDKLQEITLREGGGRLGQAAVRSLAEYAKFDKLQEAIDDESGKGKAAFDKLMKTDAAFGKAVAIARPDLAIDNEKGYTGYMNTLSPEQIAKLDNSFFNTNPEKPMAKFNGADAIQQPALDALRDSMYYGSLKKDAKDYVDSRTVRVAGMPPHMGGGRPTGGGTGGPTPPPAASGWGYSTSGGSNTGGGTPNSGETPNTQPNAGPNDSNRPNDNNT